MKKIMLTTMMLICGIAYAAAQAEIKFDKTTHNFGKFSESAPKVSCIFTYTNTGDAPLMILNATASCGCTRPDFPKKPVKAGKKGKIKVTYLPAGRPGEFEKTVTVKTNAKRQKKVTLRIKGFVNPDAR